MFIISVPPKPDGLELFINNISYVNNSIAIVSPGKYTFECNTRYTRPGSSVSWVFGETVVPESTHITTQSGDLTSFRSIILDKEVTIFDCNVRITCKATNEALMNDATFLSVTLRVNGMFLISYL